MCARTGKSLNELLGWAWPDGSPAPLTHRQALAWEAWLDYDEYERRTKAEWYAARDFAAQYLTPRGNPVDAKKGFVSLDRTRKRPLTRKECAAQEKAKVVAATAAGGVNVRKRTRHPDGRVTDDETGEVVYDPARGD